MKISNAWVHHWILVGALYVTANALGCGNSDAKIAPVQGVVTLDGKPLTEGSVFVTPTGGRSAKGAIRPDGTFVLGTHSVSDGVMVGTHPVTVQPPPAREGMPLSATAKLLPQRYKSPSTSGITVDVKPNFDNELVIELSSE